MSAEKPNLISISQDASGADGAAVDHDVALMRRRLWKQQARLAEVSLLLDDARNRIDQISSSRSWRITAPLRAISAWVHGWRSGASSAEGAPGLPKDPSERLHPANADDPVLPRLDASRWLMVDVTELAIEDLRGGIQHVVKGVLGELLLTPPAGWDVVPVRLARNGFYVDALGSLERVFGPLAGSGEARRIVARPGDVFLGLDLVRDHSALLRQGVGALKEQGAEVHFVVYDLLPVDLPTCFPQGVPARFEEWLSVVADLADGVACISATVAQRFARWAASHVRHEAMPKLAYFRLGIESSGQVRERARDLTDTVSILMVGTIEPRKRYDEALDAVERLWSDGEDVRLLIVGREGWLSAQLADRIRKHRNFGGRLQWHQYSSDEDVQEAYRNADCLLLCSLGEGFGLPVIEAASHRVPLILRDLPELREIAGQGATYFGGDGQLELYPVIKQWLGHRGDAAFAPDIASPSWEDCAKELLEVLGIDGKDAAATKRFDEFTSGIITRNQMDKKD